MSKSIQFKDNNNEKMYPHPFYPVGSIYLSINNTNPSTWFGGTWSLIAQGRTLVGVDTNDTDFNTSQKTGGEKKHTLTVNEMPPHNHNSTALPSSGGSGTQKQAFLYKYTDDTTYSCFVQNNGGGQSHNNLQPYFTCFIWCRTA